MSQLSTVVTGRWSLRHLVLGFRRRWKLKPRMHKLTGRSIRAKSGQIKVAQHPAHVPMPTVGPVATKATVVPRAVFDLALRINVQKRTLFVVARVEPRVKVTFRHLGHVVLVQELALVSLLTQRTQPMLADDCAVTANMPERTTGTLLTLCTVGSVEEQTNGGGRF